MSFEIRLIDDCDDAPVYYAIFKDGVRWSPYNYKDVWDAISDVEKADKDAAKYLTDLEFSIS